MIRWAALAREAGDRPAEAAAARGNPPDHPRSAALVAARIGQENAWLQVVTEDGLSGFVAAWDARRARRARRGPLRRACALRPRSGAVMLQLQAVAGRHGAILRAAPRARAIARLVPGDRLQIVDAPKSALAAAIGHRGEWVAARVLSRRGHKRASPTPLPSLALMPAASAQEQTTRTRPPSPNPVRCPRRPDAAMAV